MPKKEITGVVLKDMDLGEDDLLVTFYTREEGILRLAAPSSKRMTSDFSGMLQKFCWNDIEYYRKDSESLGSISDLELRRQHAQIKNNLKKLSYGSYVLEFIYKTGTEIAQPDYFGHLVRTLSLLMEAEIDDEVELKAIHAVFKLKALDFLGIRPRLKRCSDCQKSMSGEKFADGYKASLSIKAGGVTCCQKPEISRGRMPIDFSSFKFLVESFSRGYDILLDDRKLSVDEDRLDYINRMLDKFIDYHLDLSLNSSRFLSLF